MPTSLASNAWKVNANNVWQFQPTYSQDYEIQVEHKLPAPFSTREETVTYEVLYDGRLRKKSLPLKTDNLHKVFDIQVTQPFPITLKISGLSEPLMKHTNVAFQPVNVDPIRTYENPNINIEAINKVRKLLEQDEKD